MDFSNALYPSDEEKLGLALELARRNVEARTGGPFGAAVFDMEDNSLVAVGVNRVIPHHNSVAHAEMMALMLAQQHLESPRLDAGRRRLVLATSAQPCSMCFGALSWSGISRVLVGARRSDVERLTGFDEGPLPRDWKQSLSRRGISVTCDVLRTEARAILQDYQKKGYPLY